MFAVAQPLGTARSNVVIPHTETFVDGFIVAAWETTPDSRDSEFRFLLGSQGHEPHGCARR